MRLKDEETNEKERILREPNYLANQEEKVKKQLLAEALRCNYLELEFERKARKDVESGRENVESSHNHHKASVYDWDLEKMNRLGKQRDEILHKKVGWMKKGKISK